MKKYYLNLLSYLLIGFNSAFTIGPEDEIKPPIEVKDITTTKELSEEISANKCDRFNLEKDDVLKKLIDSFSDEKLIKIIFQCKLLEKNYDAYLCEIDQTINRCFKLNNKRFNLNNVVHFLKATTFFSCAAGCFYYAWSAWRNPKDLSEKGLYLGLSFLSIVGSLFGLHGITEIDKIYSNYDQNQLFYKALAIRNALLDYRKENK